MMPFVLLSSMLNDQNQAVLSRNYINAVSGVCAPAIGGSFDPADADSYARAFAGLILTGGPDIAPSRYGQDTHSETKAVSQEYDAFDISLFHAFNGANKPILGICRGLQVINVSLGGSLIQHIPDTGTAVQHTLGGEDAEHKLILEDSSYLSILGIEVQNVNSNHHQAIDRLGAGLHVAARSQDDIIEAIQTENGRVIGVQWHPERYDHPLSNRIFEYFASLCI